jgi:hypothetical protein
MPIKKSPKKAAPKRKKTTPRLTPAQTVKRTSANQQPVALPKTFADLIAPFSTAELAEAVGINPDNVSAWKVGRYLPGPKKLKVIAKFCKFDFDMLVEVWTRERSFRLSRLRGKPKAAARS